MQERTRNSRENNGTNKRRSRRDAAVAKRAALGALLASAVCVGTLRAQSIINETSDFNNRADVFSNVSAKKIALLDASSPRTPEPSGSLSPTNRVDVKLAAPTGAPRETVGSTCRVPFVFSQGADSATATAVELFCSPDLGATWYAYAAVRPEDGRDAFVFQAPKPGVYWFALKTSFSGGGSAFSSTRAYRFVEPASASSDASAASETFALNDDSESAADAPPLGAPTASDVEKDPGEQANKLLDLARGTRRDAAPQKGEAGEVDASRPATGKIKSLGPAKEKGTDRLVLVLRWYRPSELEESRRGRPATIAVERATDPNGPWTRIADSLSSEREWYSWFAGAAETTPFYVRTVATDDEGNEWIDATPQPLDLSTKWVRSALGRVVWPGSKDDGRDGATDEETPSDGESDAESGAKSKASVGGLIRNASSTDSVDVDAADVGNAGNDDEESESGETKRSRAKKMKKSDATERAQSTAVAPRRPRPNVPAPTNPNEFSLNPLFTQGFGVLFQAAQTRRGDGESDANRSIFTPPNRAKAASTIAPAEYANASADAARRRATARARDMSRYEKSPELMEGMVFYQDENGKLTTTPPADFQTAGAENAFGGSFADLGATTIGTGPNGEPTVLPGDNETYDANPNSGAASLTNGMYPNAATPGNSPLNRRYETPSTVAPGASYVPSAFPSGGFQTIPETSFGPRTVPSNAPVYAPTPGGTSGPGLFPPRPSVAR